jgi:16S rRNA (uracil1498-N3)-methyltransferase
MEVRAPVDMRKAVENLADGSLSIIPWEGEEGLTIPALRSSAEAEREKAGVCVGNGTVNIFIGPEGGFSMKEIELAQKHNVMPVTLGQRILRVETAAILSAILVLNQYGEFGSL